jgi:2-succinyl-5-enolpyruvyl-6-hydroxy-3-cyclohexene-1-carboxylate synthase
VFATPHGVDLAALAAASHTAYTRVSTRAGLRVALADHTPGLRVVEARVPRADRRATAARIAALADALPGAGVPR